MAAAFVALTAARPGAAQEIEITGPLEGACIARLDSYSVPARFEWAYWAGSGLVADFAQNRFDRPSPFVAIGAEVTTGVAQYIGFPAPSFPPSYSRRARPWHGGAYAELRIGPWAQIETRAASSLVEAGLTAHLGTVRADLRSFAAPAGMFDLRVGGGYGAFPGSQSPDLTLGLAWGYRVVFDRVTWGGACDEPPEPRPVADATILRLVTTVRRATDLAAWQVAIGLELSPTIVLAPARFEERRYRKERAHQTQPR